MPEMNDNAHVTYTVKDLIGQLDEKVDKVLEKLDAKADMAKVEALIVRVDVLEKGAIARAARLSTAQRIWLTVLSIVAVVSPIVTAAVWR